MAVLIGLVGLQACGKTTLAKEIAKKFKLNHVRTDAVREFLINNITYYTDSNYSYYNPLINSANRIVAAFRNAIMTELLMQDQSLILDSCGNTKVKRKIRFDVAKKNCSNLKIIIIHVKVDEKVILSRLKERDKKKGDKWIHSYETFWKKTFEVPKKGEADLVLTYDTTNKKQIMDELAKIVNS